MVDLKRLVTRMPTFGVLFGCGLLVYAPRAYRALALAGDSAELATAARVWGVPHPPGYPLYTLVAHLFTRLPLEPTFAAHLMSAVLHAAAIGFVGCAIEVATGSRFASWVGAAILALGRVFFLGSLYAEVFPLNDLVFACLLLLGVRVARSEANAPWFALALALGIGFAHHPMIVLSLPALAMLVGAALVRESRRRPWRTAWLGALALGVAVLAYALVPLAAAREPYISWGDVHDARSLLGLVMRDDYGGPLHASRKLAEGQLLERLDAFTKATFTSFGVVGSALVALGAVVAFRRDRRVGGALLVAALFTGPLFAAANAFDIHSTYRVAFFERFFAMSHVPLAVLAGFGAAWFEVLLTGAFRAAGRGALAALAVGPLLSNLTKLDMSANHLGAAYAHDLVASAPDGALVLLKGDMPTQAALYACGVERRCGERIVFAPGQLEMPWRRAQVERRYPSLSLAPEANVDAMISDLVEKELARRPVLVHEELLDAAATGTRAAVPSGLLFRIYPTTDAARADWPHFRDALAAFARGERCEGCALRKSPHPLDDQLARAYESALRANAAAASELGADAHL